MHKIEEETLEQNNGVIYAKQVSCFSANLLLCKSQTEDSFQTRYQKQWASAALIFHRRGDVPQFRPEGTWPWHSTIGGVHGEKFLTGNRDIVGDSCHVNVKNVNEAKFWVVSRHDHRVTGRFQMTKNVSHCTNMFISIKLMMLSKSV